MSRLVDDPLDAAPFMPLLMPALEKAADMMSDPEARGVCEKSLSQLTRLNRDVEEAKLLQQHIAPALVITSMKKIFKGLEKANSTYVDFIASIACSLMACRKFDDWKEVEEFIAVLGGKGDIAEFKKECESMCKALPKKDDEVEDPALELCNCVFTLAYGKYII